MDNIDKLKLGDNIDFSLMHGGIIKDPNDYRYNFTQWNINEDALVSYNIEPDRLIIRSFKPNTWLIKSSQSMNNTDMCQFSKNLKLIVEGLSANADVFDQFYSKNSVVWGSGGTQGHGLGLLIMPWCTNSNATSLPELPWSTYIWDSMTTVSGNVQVASELILRGTGNGYNRYAHTSDGTVLFTPDWISYPCPWDSWNLSIGLFTGNTSVVDENGCITLDTPIIITQMNDNGINVANEECWNAYMGTEQVYHKNKTVENCWIRHGLATIKPYDDDNLYHLVINAESAKQYGKYYLDLVTDLQDWLENANGSLEHPFVKIPCTPTNTDVHEFIASYYATHYAPSNAYNSDFGNGDRHSGLFSYSPLEEISIKLGTDDPDYQYMMTLNCAFSKCKAYTINIDLQEDCTISVSQHMFYECNNLQTITYTGKPCSAHDCSGMFLGCTNLQTYPANLINWGNRKWHEGTETSDTNMAYFADNCPNLHIVPAYPGTTDENTIVLGGWCELMFSNSPNLIEIGPILDFKYVDPQNGNAARACLNCSNLSSVKIKNLNHGNWNFTGTHGQLDFLDAESIEYLFSNLFDLTDTSRSETDPSRPKRSSATLTVPSSWNVSDSVKAQALVKGWTVIQA